MSIENFIPEVWAAAIEVPYTKNLVYTQPAIANRKYEGQVSQQGDTVHVTTISAPTVKQYLKGQDIEVEELDDDGDTITVDQAKYWAIGVNDLDKVQAAGDFEGPATNLAGENMKNEVDTFAAGLFTALTPAITGTQKVVDGKPEQAGPGQTYAYHLLVKLREALDKESVPTSGRYVVVSPEFVSALLMDPRYTDLSASGSSEALLNGQVGRATGFNVLVSNNVPKSGTGGKDHLIVAGIPDALSFISQFTKTEAMRDPKQFRDIIRGLNIYGGKVMRPEAVATVKVTFEPPATETVTP